MPKKTGTSNGRISKMAAVREALRELGKSAKPLQIQEYVKTKHAVVMSTGMVSNYKSLLLAKKKAKKRGPKPAGTASAVTAHPTPPSRGSISLDDIRAVKALADRIGVEKVKELAAVLAK